MNNIDNPQFVLCSLEKTHYRYNGSFKYKNHHNNVPGIWNPQKNCVYINDGRDFRKLDKTCRIEKKYGSEIPTWASDNMRRRYNQILSYQLPPDLKATLKSHSSKA